MLCRWQKVAARKVGTIKDAIKHKPFPPLCPQNPEVEIWSVVLSTANQAVSQEQ